MNASRFFEKNTIAFNMLVYCLKVAYLFIFSNTVLALPLTKVPLKTTAAIEKGEHAFLRGDFENAIIHWTERVQNYAENQQTDLHITTLIKLANSYYALGQHSQALEILNQANKRLKEGNNLQQSITILKNLGAAHLALGNYSKANGLLQRSVELARKDERPDLLAASLINLGNLKASQNEYNQALDAYSESTKIAQASGNFQLAAKASVNTVIAAFETEHTENITGKLEKAKGFLEKTNNDHNKAFSWISLGQIAQGLLNKQPDQSQWQSFAYDSFKQAEKIGNEIDDVRAISYAKGFLGKLYYQKMRYDEALQLTRQAVFSINGLQAPEILYRWQWQTGRILKAKGNNEAAIFAYQQAISTLNPIRQDLSDQQFGAYSFQEEIGAIYLQLADLFLQATNGLEEGEKYQQNLIDARNIIEQLKAAELQDYFKDDCVSALQKKIKALDTIDPHSAIVYPILLPDRVEILLSLPTGLKRFTVLINRETIINEVRLFRQKLENRTTREYLPHAQTLYQWLVAPFQETLAQYEINTLVMVPDAFLRTIPMAALHDGEKFLIEKYAIGNTPGLNITDSKPLTKKNAQVLAIGLTESVQGFPALPYVTKELSNINKMFGGTVLKDKDFLLSNVQAELKQISYTIVHIASHGQFKSDAKENFILTFNGKLNMNGLEQLIKLSKFRENPVELLTLSACQTAAGDDRAALGLAGIAIKAGARSAIATLWFINDQAASLLISGFYQQLKKGTTTKAQAIKNAQTHIINNTPYKHPYFWSPFLLIGNWL